VLLSARSPGGALAWTSPQNRAVILGPTALHVAIGGRTTACRLAFCSEAVGPLWWNSNHELFLFQGGTRRMRHDRLLRWRPAIEREPGHPLHPGCADRMPAREEYDPVRARDFGTPSAPRQDQSRQREDTDTVRSEPRVQRTREG
jgi:hypothetical protein